MVARRHGSPLSRSVQEEEEEGWKSEGEEVVGELNGMEWVRQYGLDHNPLGPLVIWRVGSLSFSFQATAVKYSFIIHHPRNSIRL